MSDPKSIHSLYDGMDPQEAAEYQKKIEEMVNRFFGRGGGSGSSPAPSQPAPAPAGTTTSSPTGAVGVTGTGSGQRPTGIGYFPSMAARPQAIPSRVGIDKNLNPRGDLTYPYNIGDYVQHYCLPEYKYRVRAMRHCLDMNSGGYEVQLELLEGLDAGHSITYWFQASEYYPTMWRPDMKPQKDPKYPHTCPRCGSKAYVGFYQVDCTAKCKLRK